MNREIKFRAWDKINKRMVFPYSIDLVREHEGIQQGQYYFDHSAINFDDAILMQFTGLLDNNNVEIYEGDIVKYNDELFIINFGYWEPGHGDHIQSAYGYYLDPIDKEKRYYEYCPDKTCEIIGNIYEHSHVLPEHE